MKKEVLLVMFLLFIALVSASSLKVTQEHPFFIDGEWVPASALEVGDELTALDGSQVRVTDVKDVLLENPVDVYNLDSLEFNNFIIKDNLIVHNSEDIGDTRVTIRGDRLNRGGADKILNPVGTCKEITEDSKLYATDGTELETIDGRVHDVVDIEESIYDKTKDIGYIYTEKHYHVQGDVVKYDEESKMLTIEYRGKLKTLKNVERHSDVSDNEKVIVTKKGPTYLIDFETGNSLLMETPEGEFVGELPNPLYDETKKRLVYQLGKEVIIAEVKGEDRKIGSKLRFFPTREDFQTLVTVDDGYRVFNMRLDENGNYYATLFYENEAIAAAENIVVNRRDNNGGSWALVYEDEKIVLLRSRFGINEGQLSPYFVDKGVFSRVFDVKAYDSANGIIVYFSYGNMMYRDLNKAYGRQGRQISGIEEFSFTNFDGKLVEWDGKELRIEEPKPPEPKYPKEEVEKPPEPKYPKEEVELALTKTALEQQKFTQEALEKSYKFEDVVSKIDFPQFIDLGPVSEGGQVVAFDSRRGELVFENPNNGRLSIYYADKDYARDYTLNRGRLSIPEKEAGLTINDERYFYDTKSRRLTVTHSKRQNYYSLEDYKNNIAIVDGVQAEGYKPIIDQNEINTISRMSLGEHSKLEEYVRNLKWQTKAFDPNKDILVNSFDFETGAFLVKNPEKGQLYIFIPYAGENGEHIFRPYSTSPGRELAGSFAEGTNQKDSRIVGEYFIYGPRQFSYSTNPEDSNYYGNFIVHIPGGVPRNMEASISRGIGQMDNPDKESVKRYILQKLRDSCE